MPEEPKPTSIQQPQIVVNPQVPVTYVNGTVVALSAPDMQITLAVNGRAFNTLIMNHSVAKFLHLSLGKALTDFETKTGTTINDLVKINESLKSTNK